mgnify:CR=1 FL=1
MGLPGKEELLKNGADALVESPEDILDLYEENAANKKEVYKMYTEECIQTFLENQEQLFDEPVAENYEEAEAFLEDCMAVVADSISEVRKYLSGMGADVDGMSDDELEEASEVFVLPDGKISDRRGIRTASNPVG